MLPLLKRLKPWLILGLTIAVLGCIETFDAGRATGSDYLVVDAALDNTASGRSVKLGLATQPFGFPTTAPVPNAQIRLQTIGGATVSLAGTGGTYTLPADFQVKPGAGYKLLIRLADGRQYESGTETMPAVVPIQQVRRQFDPEGYQGSVTTNTRLPAHNLLVDFQDPADGPNYYQWTYIVWEKQAHCTSCYNGLYDDETDKCTSFTTKTTFDYVCNGLCWQIIRSTGINSTSDALFNGKPVTGRLAGVLPYYQTQPCLVAVQQRSLSAGAYRYAVILADQSQNTGGLADTPPAGLGGNVRNLTDEAETVLGYFSVSGVSEVLYWNDRTDAPSSTKAIGLLGGRLPNPEPTGIYGRFRPPLAPCVQSDSRTPTKPTGWQN